MGEVTHEKVEIARQADHIFISEIRKAGLYDQISQAYAAVDPSRAVGVQGDKRVYGYIIILRAVCTTDFMTATACELSSFTESPDSTTDFLEISRVRMGIPSASYEPYCQRSPGVREKP